MVPCVAARKLIGPALNLVNATESEFCTICQNIFAGKGFAVVSLCSAKIKILSHFALF